MYLNEFAEGLEPLDMTSFDEFASLIQSANDLGIPYPPDVRYISRHTVIRRQRFHFLEWGDPTNPPIVLLHGGNQSAHSWDLVSLHLSNAYHVYALDQRGHGDSEWSRDCNYSLETMAEDVESFIRNQSIEEPIIFGHSMGGLVTMTLTRSHPKLPKAIVLVDVGPELNTQGTQMIRDFVQRNIAFDDMEAFLDIVEKYDPFRSRDHLERTIKYNLMQGADGKYVTKVDSRLFTRDDKSSKAKHLQTISLEDAKQFPCPTLVVRGEDSQVLTAMAAERFVATLPKGTLITVSNCGHNVHSQNTPGFIEGIGPFFASIG